MSGKPDPGELARGIFGKIRTKFKPCGSCEGEMIARICQPFGHMGDLLTIWWVCSECGRQAMVNVHRLEEFALFTAQIMLGFEND